MDVFEICGVIDQVDHIDYEYEVKTGTGSSFRRHFDEKPIFWVFLGFSRANISVAMGHARPILGTVSYVLGINIRGKFQGRSSRASHICQVRHFGNLNIFAHTRGGLHPPAKPLSLNFFLRHYILCTTMYQHEMFWFSGRFSFGDTKP